jgi:predicted DNA-binding transcriptional regulator AlpA
MSAAKKEAPVDQVLLDVYQCAARFRISRSWFLARVKEGSLPRPHKLGKRCARWIPHEIDAAVQRLLRRPEQRAPASGEASA